MATYDARLPHTPNHFIGLRSAAHGKLLVGGRFNAMPKPGDTVIAENGEPFFFIDVVVAHPKGSFVATIKRYGDNNG